jgi:hypothetical protein
MKPHTMTASAGPLPDPDLQRRLRRLARFVRVLIVLGAVALVGAETWSWSSPERALELLRRYASKPFHVSAQTCAAGALFSLIPSVVLLLALHRLWGLFGEYERGRVFSRRALVCLRGFASWLLVDAVVSPIYNALMSVVATWENGPGRRELNVQFGSDDYTQLLFGLVVLAISTVMVEAARVAEDNEGFV